jgi:glycerol-3-phosphate O-acyltransferase/dihydroxyacetone phosphate acyltransferase
MWLLPAFSAVGRVAMRTYFRLRVEGFAVPRHGPVMLVANHPNSLLDPALVAAAARRPVRFLAKAPLFSVPVIGWLAHGAGAIPVHRRQDDPTQMDRNVDAFEAAYAALVEEESALGIFPEGMSHDEPSIAPLRTGAARIALEAASRLGAAFPLIPIGLVFREKETFRSEALVVIGQPIGWEDLVPLGTSPEAVRDLIGRIEYALRKVTLNLETWEDAPLVESAYAIFAAEFGLSDSAAARLGRIRAGTRRLAELRRSGNDRWQETARGILRHRRLLAAAGLTPADLRASGSLRAAAWRAGRVIPFLTALALAGGAIGTFFFWPPYRLVGLAERVLKPQLYVRSTTKLLAGIVLFGLYIAAIAALIAFLAGARWGIIAAAILPFAALATIGFRERWRAGRQEARLLLLRRTRAARIAEMRTRQRRLAESIAELIEADAPAQHR